MKFQWNSPSESINDDFSKKHEEFLNMKDKRL